MEQTPINVTVDSENTVPRPRECPHCGSDFLRQDRLFTLYNPNGEYVEGYGHLPVYCIHWHGWICLSCNWSTNGNPTVLPRPR